MVPDRHGGTVIPGRLLVFVLDHSGKAVSVPGCSADLQSWHACVRPFTKILEVKSRQIMETPAGIL
jgi:hypothetical protein